MGVKKYTQEVIKEGKRVRWPKKDEFFPSLLTVIVICVICALILTLWDWVAGTLINQLNSLFSGLKGSTAAPDATSAADALINLFRM